MFLSYTRHTLQEYKGYFALSQIIYRESLLKSTNTQKQYTDIYKRADGSPHYYQQWISQNRTNWIIYFDC